jgi:hypothetical protein
MVIETTQKEILIRLPKIFDIDNLTKLLNYFRGMEILSKAKGTFEDSEKISKQVDENWWKDNHKDYIA